MGEKTSSTKVKKFTERTDAAQDALLRGSDLINRVKMNEERLVHFEYSDKPEIGEHVRFVDDGQPRVSVFAAVRRIGEVSEEDSQFLRAEIFDPEIGTTLAAVVEVDQRFHSAGATLKNPL